MAVVFIVAFGCIYPGLYAELMESKAKRTANQCNRRRKIVKRKGETGKKAWNRSVSDSYSGLALSIYLCDLLCI